jgi:2-polyprenyl-3-methyl-5-hydroxy-6-metoxy-1,4-benzoquinol methylase
MNGVNDVDVLSRTASSVARSASETPAACRACQGPVSDADGRSPALVRCDACGLTALRDIPAREVIQQSYQEDYYEARTGARFFGAAEFALGLLKRLRCNAILRRQTGPGRILDVGCGRGDLLDLFAERGWEVLGTQLSRTAAEAARRSRGVDVLLGELPELAIDGRFDVVTFFHVLEHLDRPGEYLRRAYELLQPQGLLVIEVPNCAGVGFRLLERRHFCFDYPNHLLHFTPQSLERLLARSGFRVEERSFFSLEYSPYTTLQNLLNLLPGEPNRLYRSFMRNADGKRLRASPVTWCHGLLGLAVSLPAFAIAVGCAFVGGGNTMRLYCRIADSTPGR